MVVWFIIVVFINLFKTSDIVVKLKNKIPFLFYFINQWSVFCPIPINSDTHFYYRDLLINGETTEAKLIDISEGNFFFHRERIFLERLYAQGEVKNNNYEALKKYLSFYEKKPNVLKRQILAIESKGCEMKSHKIVLVDYV
ncbi:hypothetical protein ACQY1Q_11180 [Tenacibaculum sp. TC6]